MHADFEEKVKPSTRTPNVYKGLKIGQYRVIAGGHILLPKQYYLSIITIIVTLGPALVQLLYNNRVYIDIKRELKANMDLAKDQSIPAEPEKTQSAMNVHNAIYSVLLFLSLATLIITCITDPGIIPRGSEEKLSFMY